MSSSPGIPLDIYSRPSAENWGMAMVVRTGPADFNKRSWHASNNSECVITPTEGCRFFGLMIEVGDY